MQDRLNFQKLDSGEWGVKVQTRQPLANFAGTEQMVPKRKGGYSSVRLGGIVQKWNYADTKVGVFTIQRDERKQQPREARHRNYTDWPAAEAAEVKPDCAARLAKLTDDALAALGQALCTELEHRSGYAHVIYTP